MPWRITVRRGPEVERLRLDDLPEALDVLERRAQEAAASTRLHAVDLRVRRYEAADQIAARAELKGPQRLRPVIHAGFDVHGDGSVVPWTGGVNREAVTTVGGETVYAALRRAVQSRNVDP
jgi:hypothetical protein